MQATWAPRMKETFAILAIGDGAIELISPREHSLPWEVGPEGARKAARFFAENPNYMRLIGAAQIAFGLWLALRQFREGQRPPQNGRVGSTRRYNSAMAHAHEHPHERTGGESSRALAIVLALTTTFTVAEIVGGLLTGSLALLADAGHMLSDNLSLGIALLAAWLAGRPATPEKSFGYKRAEILAALANGVTLVAISIWIFVEAYSRLQEPPEILGGPVLAVATLGLLVNAAGAVILSRSGGENLNAQGALRHVIADALGSVGVMAAALIIVLTGWRYADPLVSVAIGALILASSWSLLRDSTNILLEATPRGIDAEEVGRRMAGAEGVVEVHDLHIWTITSGFPALSAHVLVGQSEDCHARRRYLEDLLAREYGISHTTLQVDHVGDHKGEMHGSRFLPLGEKPRDR
jgi:cobalt-zinc-cadmium efflux system protein